MSCFETCCDSDTSRSDFESENSEVSFPSQWQTDSSANMTTPRYPNVPVHHPMRPFDLVGKYVWTPSGSKFRYGKPAIRISPSQSARVIIIGCINNVSKGCFVAEGVRTALCQMLLANKVQLDEMNALRFPNYENEYGVHLRDQVGVICNAYPLTFELGGRTTNVFIMSAWAQRGSEGSSHVVKIKKYLMFASSVVIADSDVHGQLERSVYQTGKRVWNVSDTESFIANLLGGGSSCVLWNSPLPEWTARTYLEQSFKTFREIYDQSRKRLDICPQILEFREAYAVIQRETPAPSPMETVPVEETPLAETPAAGAADANQILSDYRKLFEDAAASHYDVATLKLCHEKAVMTVLSGHLVDSDIPIVEQALQMILESWNAFLHKLVQFKKDMVVRENNQTNDILQPPWEVIRPKAPIPERQSGWQISEYWNLRGIWELVFGYGASTPSEQSKVLKTFAFCEDPFNIMDKVQKSLDIPRTNPQTYDDLQSHYRNALQQINGFKLDAQSPVIPSALKSAIKAVYNQLVLDHQNRCYWRNRITEARIEKAIEVYREFVCKHLGLVVTSTVETHSFLRSIGECFKDSLGIELQDMDLFDAKLKIEQEMLKLLILKRGLEKFKLRERYIHSSLQKYQAYLKEAPDNGEQLFANGDNEERAKAGAVKHMTEAVVDLNRGLSQFWMDDLNRFIWSHEVGESVERISNNRAILKNLVDDVNNVLTREGLDPDYVEMAVEYLEHAKLLLDSEEPDEADINQCIIKLQQRKQFLEM